MGRRVTRKPYEYRYRGPYAGWGYCHSFWGAVERARKIARAVESRQDVDPYGPAGRVIIEEVASGRQWEIPSEGEPIGDRML